MLWNAGRSTPHPGFTASRSATAADTSVAGARTTSPPPVPAFPSLLTCPDTQPGVQAHAPNGSAASAPALTTGFKPSTTWGTTGSSRDAFKRSRSRSRPRWPRTRRSTDTGRRPVLRPGQGAQAVSTRAKRLVTLRLAELTASSCPRGDLRRVAGRASRNLKGARASVRTRAAQERSARAAVQHRPARLRWTGGSSCRLRSCA
jgi:hypothetical protein